MEKLLSKLNEVENLQTEHSSFSQTRTGNLWCRVLAKAALRLCAEAIKGNTNYKAAQLPQIGVFYIFCIWGTERNVC